MIRLRPSICLLALVLVSCGGGGGDPGGGIPTPPGQPALGPGGAAYVHPAVRESRLGSGNGEYWIFEPDPTPAGALPVVVFLHGWAVMTPGLYQAWIDHLVLRGNIVVYPRYQATVLTPPATFTGNAVGAVQAALIELQGGSHATPDLGRMAVGGHSYGAVLSANLAALAAGSGLPGFGAVLCLQPGTAGNDTYADYADIPAGTLLLAVAGEDDTATGDTDARRIYREATAIPTSDKDFILVRSDAYGTPALVADHMSPIAGIGSEPDALDWRGYWKWFDGLLDAAFDGVNREYALGDTTEQRSLGLWSDGRPVQEALVSDPP